MKYGRIAGADATGALLAQALRVQNTTWKKGRLLSAKDAETLAAAGIEFIVAARPEDNDITENAAAERIAAALNGENIRVAAATTGRVNIFATANGMLHYAAADVHRVNAVAEAVTIAAVAPYTPVSEGNLLATIKIIPFAVAEALVAAVQPFPFTVAPFVRRRVGLLQSFLPDRPNTAQTHDKTRRVTDARLRALDAAVVAESRVRHESAALAAALETMQAQHRPDIFLIAGATAISDRDDDIPQAVSAVGGEAIRLGMPVDPGNLLFLARWRGTPIIGLPGCAKSPKLNGFDWVLNRVIADLPVTADDIAKMGVGGLLAEIGVRPSPRQGKRPLKIAGILLAAGASQRMGATNKLLTIWRGKPLAVHAAQTLTAARQKNLLQQTVAVVGRDADEVGALLSTADLPVVRNANYRDGMASSLQCALAALDADTDAVLVCLADMPGVTVADITALTQAFADSPDDIIVPVHRGKRGNPVLLARSQFPKLRRLDGDTGARALFADTTPTSVEAGPGVLFDLDSPEQFADNAAPATPTDE